MFKFKAKPKPNNFDDLITLIERGIESTLVDIRNKYPSETFYAYVLTIDADVGCVSFHANSHENLQRVYEASGIETDPQKIEARYAELRRIFGDDPTKTAKMKHTKAAELSYYKWGWVEWMDYESIGDQEEMELTSDWLETKSQDYQDESGSLGIEWFDDVLNIVLNCMKQAFKRCDERGLFGLGKDREDVLLYVGISDGDTDGVVELNPKSTVKKYLADFKLNQV